MMPPRCGPACCPGKTPTGSQADQKKKIPLVVVRLPQSTHDEKAYAMAVCTCDSKRDGKPLHWPAVHAHYCERVRDYRIATLHCRIGKQYARLSEEKQGGPETTRTAPKLEPA